MMLSLYLGFLLGVFAVIVAEVLALLFVLDRLGRSKEAKPSEHKVARHLDHEQSLAFAHNKQGVIWVLESGKIPKISHNEKEQSNKKEIVEVFPVKKNGKIKDRSLILTDFNGSQETIQLVDCIIVAVSASSLSSRKWAKRYPIRVGSKNTSVDRGKKIFYLYLETSWEKESWCKALRLASCADKERVNWFCQLSEEFHQYLASLNAQYPSFMKPSIRLGEPTEKANRTDGSSSKVRLFLKKLAKKGSKSGSEYRPSAIPSSSREEIKISDKLHATQDTSLANGSIKPSAEETSNSSLEEDRVEPFPSTLTHSVSHGNASVFSDADSNEKLSSDEGTLCWNLLFSRLFFDAKRSTEMNTSIQARIQRTLSNIRIPSYIGGVSCTGVDIGSLPPYIHHIRVLPMDMNEVWAVEVDFEYSGGAILDIETRLEVREPDFQKGLVNSSLESNSTREVTSALLEDFENYGNQLKHSKDAVDGIIKNDAGGNWDGMKSSKSTSWKSTYMTRWKSILNSIADQVSQVPLTLAVRVTSIRGTVRLHIKPPPSDQLWFGFTSMPDIDWKLESSVGEHKITSGHIALLLGNRFKVAIRDTLVLPNCEGICVPWMLAEKDDWVPRKAAPFIWVRQEDSTGRDISNCQPLEAKMKLDATSKTSKNVSGHLEDDTEKTKNVVYTQVPPEDPSVDVASSPTPNLPTSVSTSHSTHSKALEDLRIPLVRSDETHDGCSESRLESPDYCSSRAMVTTEEQTPFGEDAKQKRIGRRARMMDLGKKMGEKLEEKRRHIEEKGRNIVDKMRGQDNT